MHKLPAAPSAATVVYDSSRPRTVLPHTMGPEPLRGPRRWSTLNPRTNSVEMWNGRKSKLLVWTPCWSVWKWVGGRSYRLSPINLGVKKRELETDPWPPNELRLAAHLENIHSYMVTHSWCDNFIPTSSSEELPACCASVTQATVYNKFRLFFFLLLEMLGLWKAIRMTVTSDLFSVPDSQTALLMLDLVGVSGPTLIPSVMDLQTWLRNKMQVNCEIYRRKFYFLDWKVCMYICEFHCEYEDGLQ